MGRKSATHTSLSPSVTLSPFFRLLATAASPINESIAPTFYNEDLYATLGVPSSATKEQIKAAYWRLAFANHPDRNSSQEALCLFRNVSYAYRVLGKDPKMRSEYDAKYKAKRYLTVLEEVGTEVLQPLTMGVALPLLNITVRSIGGVAVPLVRDALEQSSTVLRAALSVDESVKIDNIFSRAGIALELKRNEQRLRRIKEEIESVQRMLHRQQEQLHKSKNILQNLQGTLDGLINQDQGLQAETIRVREKEEGRARDFSFFDTKKNDLTQEFVRETGALQSLQLQSQHLDAVASATKEEIRHLEDTLRKAREKLYLVNNEQRLIQERLELQSSHQQQLGASLQELDVLWRLRKLEHESIRRDRAILEHELEIVKEEMQSVNQNLSKEEDLVTTIEKKITRASIRLTTLEEEQAMIMIERQRLWEEKERRLGKSLSDKGNILVAKSQSSPSTPQRRSEDPAGELL